MYIIKDCVANVNFRVSAGFWCSLNYDHKLRNSNIIYIFLRTCVTYSIECYLFTNGAKIMLKLKDLT